MYIKQACIFAFIAMSPAVLADVNQEIKCETSGGSPTTGDVTGVINQLKGRGTEACSQSNGLGSECTTLATDGTAAIALCGTQSSMRCQDAGLYAQAIQNKCLSGIKVGGINYLNGRRIEVFHS